MKKTNKKSNEKILNTRKSIRQNKRKQKKINRLEYYTKPRNVQRNTTHVPGKFVKRSADAVEEVVQVKMKTPKFQEILKERIKEKKTADHLKSQMEAQRRKLLLQANEDEDKVIKKLEKQLGLNKFKKKTGLFADDGLDYLLEICDRSTQEQVVAAEKHLANVDGESDFEEDLAVVTGKKIKSKNEKVEDSDSEDQDDASGMSDEDDASGMSDEDDASGMSDEDDGSEMSDIEEEDNISESEEDTDRKYEGNKILSEAGNKSETTKTKSKQIVKSKPTLKQNKIICKEDSDEDHNVDDVNSDVSGDDISDAEMKLKRDKPDVWEDIYGRKRDNEGNVIKEEKGVYVPPHLRNKDSSLDKDLSQLKRQIKSVLNKLAGTNLHWASSTIETLYANNSRNSVNTALSSLWLDATVQIAVTPDRLIAEHAALVAILQANIGTEIGAHFLQVLVKKFDEMVKVVQPVENKELDNLVAALSLLYSFKELGYPPRLPSAGWWATIYRLVEVLTTVIIAKDNRDQRLNMLSEIYHACLLYDILNRLLEELTEKNIDCVLAALRNVGGVLRKEEPLALKTFIHDTQGLVANISGTASSGSRIKFLLEVLLAVKNNNLSKIPNYDPTYCEHLKKAMRGIVRKGNYVTPLNIRLDDLLQVDERGKWWVVGSAWEGNHVRKAEEKKINTVVSSGFDQKLLELARKQRMNTDIRRSIFCIIMSAEDYMDAFEKLQQLGLKGQQDREIVHVLIACCLQETIYNPYYAVLATKLCHFDRKYQLAIQFSVWDKIKELESLSKQCTSNLAKFLTHLIMDKALALSILKVIEFSDLNKCAVRFMRQILLAIIMNEDLEASLSVFHRVSLPAKLRMFRESLRLFIQHFLMKNSTKVLSTEEMDTLKDRVKRIDEMLMSSDGKLRL